MNTFFEYGCKISKKNDTKIEKKEKFQIAARSISLKDKTGWKK